MNASLPAGRNGAIKVSRSEASCYALVPTPPGAESPQWIEKLLDGTTVLIRPICKEDAALERAFIERLSPRSRRFRFLGQVHIVSEEQLKRFTDIDYARDMAFVALVHADGEKREVGVSRYCVEPDTTSCECAVAVADAWQHRGLGTLLMRHLMEKARASGLKRMFSIDSAENVDMRDLARYLRFERHHDPNDSTQVIHSIAL